MTVSMSSFTSPIFLRMLKNMKSWMAKAEQHAQAKKFDTAVFVQARLAPDMLPFKLQIQIATDHAKGCVARLAGVEVPKFEDNENTFDELRARIDKTIAFVESVPHAKIDGSEDKTIVVPGRNGDRQWPGLAYVQQYAMPNFFFHVTTAYDILRHNGVDVGKADYLNGGA